MSKHPVMYHQAVKQLAMPALQLTLSMDNKPGSLATMRHGYRILFILFCLQLLHSFTTLQGGQNRWHFTSAAKAIPSNRITTSTTPADITPTQQFSFEYDGLLQFRILITDNSGTGFIPAIHITTTLHQSDR